MMDFAGQIRTFSFNAIAKSEKAFKNTCIGLSAAIQQDTPVDTGRLRGNWQPSINTPITSSLMDTDPSGSKVMQKIEDTGQRIKLGDTYFFTNNLIYAYPLEFFEESGKISLKAQNGFVRVNLVRWKDFLK